MIIAFTYKECTWFFITTNLLWWMWAYVLSFNQLLNFYKLLFRVWQKVSVINVELHLDLHQNQTMIQVLYWKDEEWVKPRGENLWIYLFITCQRMKCRIYKLWNISSWKVIFRSNFENDHCQQKLWHIWPRSVFRLKKTHKTSEGDKGSQDRV